MPSSPVLPVLRCLRLLLALLVLAAGPAGVAGQCRGRCNTTCATFVVVDAERGTNCSSDADLAGRTCASLQRVLDSIGQEDTASRPGDCVEVYVAAGQYTLVSPVAISQSVVLRGEYNASAITAGAAFPPRDSPSEAGAAPRPPDTTDMPPGQSSDPISAFEVTITSDVPALSAGSGGGREAASRLAFRSAQRVDITGLRFSSSPGIVTFDDISTVTIVDSSFSGFIQGAVDVYNCMSVVVQRCVFESNGPADVIKEESYRGHSAALSIGYNFDRELLLSPTARVLSSTFYNNSVSVGTKNTFSTTQILEELKFPGRGGGMSLIVNGITPVNIFIDDCLVEGNYATVFGAGIYILLDGLSNHIIDITGCNILDNSTPGSAGGMEIGFRETGSLQFVNRVLVSNTTFTKNSATFGGGAFFLVLGADNRTVELGNFAQFTNCSFANNTARDAGAAFALGTSILFESRELVTPVRMEDCEFTDNELVGSGGVINVAYLPLAFYGINTFLRSRGPAIAVQGAVVEIHGSVTLESNNEGISDGGALYLLSFGQVRLFPNASFSFINNSGALGAAMVVEGLSFPPMFSSLLHNPLCSLIFSEGLVSPLDWHLYNVSMLFEGNEADVGAAVYLNHYNNCAWQQLVPPYFDKEGVFRWQFVKYKTNLNRAHAPNETDPEWYVQSPAASISITNLSVTDYAGAEFDLGVLALDELGRPTAVGFRISSSNASTGNSQTATFSDAVEQYRFSPSTFIHTKLQEGTIETSFHQLQTTATGTDAFALVETVLEKDKSVTRFSFNSTRCSPGRSLTTIGSNFASCQCNVNNTNVLSCDGRLITITSGSWGTIDLRRVDSDLLFTYPCPYGYCRCMFQTKQGRTTCITQLDSRMPNNQCACNRRGPLCGVCDEGMGFSVLLNTCRTCSNAYAFLIPLLVVVNVVIVLVIVLPMLPLPIWIYPCLFYLQILPYMTEHFPVTFDKFRPIVYYISSALGFYYPYDFCIHAEATPLEVYTLRFIPFLVSVVVITVLTFIGTTLLNRRPRPLHGIWWVTLALFTPTLHTCFSILNCPSISFQGMISSRWFVAANIRCFTVGHIGLALFAILVILFGVALIPISFATSLDKTERFRIPRHMAIPLRRGYKYTWWSVVELSRRFFVLIFIVALPANDYALIYVLAVILAVYGFAMPYKEFMVNMLEMVLCADLLIMLLIRNTDQLVDDLQSLPNQTITGSQPMNQQRQAMPTAPGGTGSTDTCDTVEGVTSLASLLAFFYYLPLLLSLIAAVVWSIVRIRNYVKAHRKQASPSLEDSSMQPPAERHFTTTIVDINTLGSNPSSPTSVTSPNLKKGGSWYARLRQWNGSRRKSRKTLEAEREAAAASVELSRTFTTSVVTMEESECSDAAVKPSRSFRVGQWVRHKRHGSSKKATTEPEEGAGKKQAVAAAIEPDKGAGKKKQAVAAVIEPEEGAGKKQAVAAATEPEEGAGKKKQAVAATMSCPPTVPESSSAVQGKDAMDSAGHGKQAVKKLRSCPIPEEEHDLTATQRSSEHSKWTVDSTSTLV